MRIRTDGDYSHRRDTIEGAAAAWGCNKSRAVLLSCELAQWALDDLEQLLADERVPREVVEEYTRRLERRLEIDLQPRQVDVRPPD